MVVFCLPVLWWRLCFVYLCCGGGCVLFTCVVVEVVFCLPVLFWRLCFVYLCCCGGSPGFMELMGIIGGSGGSHAQLRSTYRLPAKHGKMLSMLVPITPYIK